MSLAITEILKAQKIRGLDVAGNVENFKVALRFLTLSDNERIVNHHHHDNDQQYRD